jgi:hypothetical protein
MRMVAMAMRLAIAALLIKFRVRRSDRSFQACSRLTGRSSRDVRKSDLRPRLPGWRGGACASPVAAALGAVVSLDAAGRMSAADGRAARRECARTCVARYSRQYQVATKWVTPETMQVLARYAWPGNVRELQNAIERAFALSTADTITPDDLPRAIRGRRARVPAAAGSRR